MAQAKFEITMGEPSGTVRVLKLRGQLDRPAQAPLMAAYQEASSGGAEIVLLDFREVEGIDSVGLELLITLLARAEQQKRRLVVCGLTAPVQQAFEATYLDEALEVFADEAEALQGI